MSKVDLENEYSDGDLWEDYYDFDRQGSLKTDPFDVNELEDEELGIWEDEYGKDMPSLLH
jgi:hypothetical protein